MAETKVEGKTAAEWKVIGNEAIKNADHSAGYDAYCKGLAADPDNAMILSNRALCLEKLGRLEEAVADAKRCASLRPDFAKAFLRAAAILRTLNRPGEVLEILKAAPSTMSTADKKTIQQLRNWAVAARKALKELMNGSRVRVIQDFESDSHPRKLLASGWEGNVVEVGSTNVAIQFDQPHVDLAWVRQQDFDKLKFIQPLAVLGKSLQDDPVTPKSKPGMFQPQLAMVKNGVAYVIARYQDVLIYIESEVSEVGRCAKVRILQSPLYRGLAGIAANGKSKALAITEPVYAKVVNGVLYVTGSINGASLYVRTQASEKLTACQAQALAAYTNIQDRVIQPLTDNSLAMYSSAKLRTLRTFEPYYVRSKKGTQYVRATVGGILVNFEAGICEKRASMKRAVVKVASATADYISPLISRVRCMYDSVMDRLWRIYGPYLTKARGAVDYGRATIYGVTVAIRVRTVAASERLVGLKTSFVVTVKQNTIYIQGKFADKVVLIKAQVSDIIEGTRGRIIDARGQAVAGVLALSDTIRAASGEKSVRVTAASAATGAVAMGASGGVVGATLGVVGGAICGLPLAPFTFGSSIVAGAAVGGGAGLCAGTVAGGAVGGAVGGAAGHKAYEKRESIADGCTTVLSKAKSCKSTVADSAVNLAGSAATSASRLRKRLAGTTAETGSPGELEAKLS